jgi:hypothetical protein
MIPADTFPRATSRTRLTTLLAVSTLPASVATFANTAAAGPHRPNRGVARSPIARAVKPRVARRTAKTLALHHTRKAAQRALTGDATSSGTARKGGASFQLLTTLTGAAGIAMAMNLTDAPSWLGWAVAGVSASLSLLDVFSERAERRNARALESQSVQPRRVETPDSPASTDTF